VLIEALIEALVEAPIDDLGGPGSIACASDYIKQLGSLLRNNTIVLKPESVKELFRLQLPDPKYLDAVLEIPELASCLCQSCQSG